MKTTTISIIILALIIIFLIFNSMMLNKTSDILLTKVNSMSDNPSQEIECSKQLLAYWKSLEPLISVTVTHNKVEALTDCATKIAKYAETGSTSDFITNKELFKNALENIRFSGEVSFNSIM